MPQTGRTAENNKANSRSSDTNIAGETDKGNDADAGTDAHRTENVDTKEGQGDQAATPQEAVLEEIHNLVGILAPEQETSLFGGALADSSDSGVEDDKEIERKEQERKRRKAELLKLKTRAGASQMAHLAVSKNTDSPRQRKIEAEKARLFGLKAKLAVRELDLIDAWRRLKKEKERYWEWNEKVEAILERSALDEAKTEEADQTMPGLIATLRKMRGVLDGELEKLHTADREKAEFINQRALRVDRALFGLLQAQIDADYRALVVKEKEFRYQLIQELATLIAELEEDRFALMDHVNVHYRAALLGFGPEGVSQAGHEFKHIVLDYKYRFLSAQQIWEKTRDELIASPMLAVFAILKLLLIIVVFRLWRKNADHILAGLSDQSPARSGRKIVTGFFGFVRRVRKPIEWMLLITVLFAVTSLDVYFPVLGYLRIILFWIMLGWALVLALHALASRHDTTTARAQHIQKARFKTFQLLGVLFVIVQATLSIFEFAVGRGTLYTWVEWSSYYLLIPVFFIVVRWWKPALVEWLGDGEDLHGFLRWVYSYQKGIGGLFVSTVGVVYMIGGDMIEWVISLLSEKESARRLQAYRTRSGIAKRGQSEMKDIAAPLSDDKLDILLSKVDGQTFLIEEIGERELTELNSVIEQDEKTVCALIGERGSGKTVIIERLVSGTDLESLVIDCGPTWHHNARRKLAEVLEVEQKDDDRAIARALGKYRLVCFENAHLLVRPAIGGREVLDWLRSVILLPESGPIAVVMTFNRAAWRFVFRSYRNQSMFDSTIQLPRFSDEQIAQLIDSVIEEAGLDISYKYLELPRSSEETQTAKTERAKNDFARVLWDYTAGNPGVALYWWRRSLYEHKETGELIVQLFDPPEPDSLDKMDLATQFMIITLIKLGIARPADVAECNNVEPIQAEQALRNLKRQGILDVSRKRYQVSLHWYRAVLIALKRKFLEVE